MIKSLLSIILGAIIVISVTSIALLVVYDNDNTTNETIDSSDVIPAELTTIQGENNKDYQNAQMLVNVVIKNYDKNNQEIDPILNELGFNIDSTNEKYVFVYDIDTKNMVAHPNSDLIGKNVFEELIVSLVPVNQIDAKLNDDGQSIMRYEWVNPETQTEQVKTSYLKLHDGLVFGSGYFEN